MGVVAVFGLATIIATNGDNNGPTEPPAASCSLNEFRSLFVATFDSDAVGLMPAPAPAYGPPGANLIVQGSAGTAVVVDSPALGSKALSITRHVANPTTVDAIAGMIDNQENDQGAYVIRYRAHGAAVPQHLIAGVIAIVSDQQVNDALNIKLFDGAYHALEGGTYVELTGNYDPTVAHDVRIELDLDTKTYSFCVNGIAIASNRPFINPDFSEIHMPSFFAPQTITEAFEANLVVDEIRILK